MDAGKGREQDAVASPLDKVDIFLTAGDSRNCAMCRYEPTELGIISRSLEQ